MDIHSETVRQDPVTGSSQTVRVSDHVASPAARDAAAAARANDWIWYVVGVIDTLLAIRLLFLLFGANNTGFASFIYGITRPFVAPFRGIFGSPGVETGYFDTAALLAIVVYALIGWGIASLIDVSRRRAA